MIKKQGRGRLPRNVVGTFWNPILAFGEDVLNWGLLSTAPTLENISPCKKSRKRYGSGLLAYL
jgi:hypothetical protein